MVYSLGLLDCDCGHVCAAGGLVVFERLGAIAKWAWSGVASARALHTRTRSHFLLSALWFVCSPPVAVFLWLSCSVSFRCTTGIQCLVSQVVCWFTWSAPVGAYFDGRGGSLLATHTHRSLPLLCTVFRPLPFGISLLSGLISAHRLRCSLVPRLGLSFVCVAVCASRG